MTWTLNEKGPIKRHFWRRWSDRLITPPSNDNLPQWARVAA